MTRARAIIPSASQAAEAARRVDVQADVALRVFSLEEQQLGDDQVGHVIFDLVAQEDDPVLEQAAVDVVGPLAAARAFDDHRDEHQRFPFLGRMVLPPAGRRGRLAEGAAG